MATEQYSIRPFAAIAKQWESMRKNVHETYINPTVINIDWIESIIVGGFVIASGSFNDYVNRIEIPLRRTIIAWSIIIVDLLYILKYIYIMYRDELDIYYLFGFPLYGVSSPRLFLLPFGILIAFGCFSRMLTLVLERKYRIEGLDVLSLIANPLERGGLNDKNYLNLSRLNAVAKFIIPKVFASIYISIFFFVAIQSVRAFFNPEIPFSYTLLIGLIIFPFCAWLNFFVFMAGFIAYMGTLLFLTFRFKQVAERIKTCARLSELMAAIVEHNELCVINYRNNYLLKWILFEVYYIGSVVIDLSVLQAVYFKDLLTVRLLYCLCALVVVSLFFMMAFTSAMLSAAAHAPYKSLNSLIAKSWLRIRSRQIPLENKWKINNMIERLAQTEITVWCLDLFPLNYYELYLFIAAVASNFFLFLSLAK